MNRYAVIEGDTATNVILAEAAYAAVMGWVLCPDYVSIGWRHIGNQWLEPLPVPPVVPASVTMRQARIVLRRAGIESQVDAAIDAMPAGDAKDVAQITWQRSSEVQRDNAVLIQLASALGLTSQQLDELFIAAAAVP